MVNAVKKGLFTSVFVLEWLRKESWLGHAIERHYQGGITVSYTWLDLLEPCDFRIFRTSLRQSRQHRLPKTNRAVFGFSGAEV